MSDSKASFTREFVTSSAAAGSLHSLQPGKSIHTHIRVNGVPRLCLVDPGGNELTRKQQ